MKLNAVPVGWDFQRLRAEKRLPVGDDFLNDDRRDQIVVYHASGIHYYHALLGGERQPAGCAAGAEASLVFMPSSIPKRVVSTIEIRPSAKLSRTWRATR